MIINELFIKTSACSETEAWRTAHCMFSEILNFKTENGYWVVIGIPREIKEEA